jgi:hypothetical protein
VSERRYEAVEGALRERINGLVDEALANGDKPLSLSEIEEIALKVRARIGAAVTQALVAKQAPVGVAGSVCEACGQDRPLKGQQKRRVVSRSGEVVWARAFSLTLRH